VFSPDDERIVAMVRSRVTGFPCNPGSAEMVAASGVGRAEETERSFSQALNNTAVENNKAEIPSTDLFIFFEI
jgi:hypothetical protein